MVERNMRGLRMFGNGEGGERVIFVVVLVFGLVLRDLKHSIWQMK